MKQILFFLLFFQCISIFSQDWQIFHSGRTRFYDKGTKALRVDSAFYQNGDSILKFYNCLNTYFEPTVGESVDTTGSTFFGSQLTIKPNGDQHLYFKLFDTLFIPKNIQLNDTWNAIQLDSGQTIMAKLIQIDTVHAFDYIDSVRVIQLFQSNPINFYTRSNYYYSLNIDSAIIKISKNNGLFSTNLSLQTEHSFMSNSDTLESSPDIRPLIREIYEDIQIGDIYGYRWNALSTFNYLGNRLDIYTDKSVFLDSMQFAYNEKSTLNTQSGPNLLCECKNYTIKNLNDSLFTSLPDEYPVKINSSMYNLMTMRQNTIGGKPSFAKLRIKTKEEVNLPYPAFEYYETTGLSLFEPNDYSYYFSPNLGGYERGISNYIGGYANNYFLEYYDKTTQSYGTPINITVSCTNCFTNIPSSTSNSNFSLYPNPATTSFSIESPSKISNIEIFNLLGSQVFFQNIDNKNFMEINVKELQSGMYVVKLETENGTFSQKWIKE